jgi:ABC-type uncharacterized transport system substrate-binding protein
MLLRRFPCPVLAVILILSSLSPALGADMTVAVIKGSSLLPYEEVLAGFAEGMKQQNLSAAFVNIEEGRERQALEAKMALIRPSLILCLDQQALERAAPIRNIPKVYALIAAANLAPWSGRDDVRGVALDIAPATQFAILRQAFPEGRRIGVLYDPSHNRAIIEEAGKAASATGFSLQAFGVGAIREIPLAFEKLEKNADLLWTLYDQTVYSPEPARYVLMQSLQRRIPAVGFSPHFAKAGALLALYGDYHDMGQQAALQALALRSGQESITRMSSPRTVKIAVNEKVGRFLGVTFSPAFRKKVNQSF